MKITTMVMDVFIRFRMMAIAQSDQGPQAWEMQVMCIQQVTDTLISLGFLDSRSAALLTEASTTITPQLGITTTPLSDFVSLVEFADPEFEPISPEAQEGHVLIARGETTEEAPTSAGFVLKMGSQLQ